MFVFKHAPFLALAGLLTAGCSAATIYSTGFESPFTVGTLNGQGGWLTAGTETVSTASPQTGTQDEFLLGNTPTIILHSDPTSGSPLIIAAANLAFLNPILDPWVYVISGGPGSGSTAASVTINPDGSLTFANSAFHTAAGTITTGGYNQFALIADFGTGTYSFALNGTTLVSGIAMLGGTNGGRYDAIAILNTASNGGGLFVDNVFVGNAGSSTPEPGTPILLGGGLVLLGLGLWRKKSA